MKNEQTSIYTYDDGSGNFSSRGMYNPHDPVESWNNRHSVKLTGGRKWCNNKRHYDVHWRAEIFFPLQACLKGRKNKVAEIRPKKTSKNNFAKEQHADLLVAYAKNCDFILCDVKKKRKERRWSGLTWFFLGGIYRRHVRSLF